MEHETFIAVARGSQDGSVVKHGRESASVEIWDNASGSPLVRVTALLSNGIPWVIVQAIDSSVPGQTKGKTFYDGPLEDVVSP